MEPTAKASRGFGRHVRHDQLPTGAVKKRSPLGQDRPSRPLCRATLYLLTVSRDHCPWRRRRPLDEYVSIDLPASRARGFTASPEKRWHAFTAAPPKILPLGMVETVEIIQPGTVFPVVGQFMEDRLLELALPIKAAAAVVEGQKRAVPEVDAAVFRDTRCRRFTQSEQQDLGGVGIPLHLWMYQEVSVHSISSWDTAPDLGREGPKSA